jgi:hypothetical protein
MVAADPPTASLIRVAAIRLSGIRAATPTGRAAYVADRTVAAARLARTAAYGVSAAAALGFTLRAGGGRIRLAKAEAGYDSATHRSADQLERLAAWHRAGNNPRKVIEENAHLPFSPSFPSPSWARASTASLPMATSFSITPS